ncbi:unnamed protein product [Cylindrotheca closterium]|uniref:Protochlorophyllide reductase n=1 Tax=Cylindrotheca closterium TaxID=2856 RepID=A0AAD2FHC0_9STRA|nr:unnamed protein product [Cylindrotheca closterium]
MKILPLLVASTLLFSLLDMSSALARTILITGATDGIGQHTAKKLAADGNILLVHGRRPNVGADLVQDLKTRGAKEVYYFNADLSDLDQVHVLAKEVSETTEAIDVLINNAGVFDPTPAHSVQGYDMTWAVNVMTPFLLTRKLLPLVANSKDDCPRIITTSSISQSSSLPPLEELFETNEIAKSGHRAYSDSKLGDLMFTVQLAKILMKSADEKYQKIKCLTMDPGTVNTKMLLAGWGACGIDVRDANNTYKLATEYGAKQESGTYHFGGRGSSDAKSDDKLNSLWKALETHTGCTYDDI